MLILLSAWTTMQLPELNPIEKLGKSIFYDKISEPDNQSCADCHAPQVGFTGPNPGINLHGAVYMGASAQMFGNRKPPASAYTGDPIPLHFNAIEGVWVGGMFWDGRATGDVLGDPLAEQAMGPFLNPLEQNNANALAVLTQIYFSQYAHQWEEAFGVPLTLDPNMVVQNYQLVGTAIAAYERSAEVNPFTSKYDYYLAGEVELNNQEMWGLELFNGKGKCSACHTNEGLHPLFTDFTYDNLGVPKNPENPFYSMPAEYNPLGEDWIDLGLGGYLQQAGYPEDVYLPEFGKFKVPTLRNVDRRPGNGFAKAYMHNGAFKSLREVVDFYNTRDVDPFWAEPEYIATMNTDELGNLQLTDAEVDAIVAFMRTLSDGYKPGKSTELEFASNAEILFTSQLPSSVGISFRIPESGKVVIDIFNITGIRVGTLLNGTLEAGNHETSVSTSELKPGIYIINMKASGQSVSAKMTII